MAELLTRLVAQYRELKRRKVIRAAAAYAVGGWIAVQVASIVFPALGFPRWTVTATVLTALAGFPVSLVLAWVIEPVPEGADPGREAVDAVTEDEDAPDLAEPPPRFRVVHPLGLLLLVVAVVGTGGWLVWQGRPLELSAFPARGSVVLADFRAEAAEATLGPALTAGLELSLEQSPHVNLMPRSRIQAAMRRMRMPTDAVVDAPTAREVAHREGADLVLLPTVAAVGESFRLGVRIERPTSGEGPRSGARLRTLTARADDRDELLTTLDGLAADVREVLGEPKLWVMRRSKPLERVTTSSLQALEQYSRARRAHVRNDFEEARRYYENAVREDSSFITAVASLGMLEYERFDRERGRKLLERAVQGADDLPDRERYGVLTGHAIVVEQDLEKAFDYQESLADLYPDSYVPHNNLGRIAYLLGRYERSADAYARALELYPALGIASNGLYYVLAFQLHRVDSAVSVARNAVRADSADAMSWMQLGMGLAALDSVDAAVSALRRSLEIAPGVTDNEFRLAHLLRIRGRHDEAASVLRGVLARDSTAHAAHYDLGVVLAAAGREEDARAHLRENLAYWSARAADAESARPLYHRAIVLARLGETDRALRTLDEALAADSTLYFDRARARALLGEEERAVGLLRRALDAGYDDVIWMKVHPDLAALRDRGEFRRMLEEGLFGGRTS